MDKLMYIDVWVNLYIHICVYLLYIYISIYIRPHAWPHISPLSLAKVRTGPEIFSGIPCVTYATPPATLGHGPCVAGPAGAPHRHHHCRFAVAHDLLRPQPQVCAGVIFVDAVAGCMPFLASHLLRSPFAAEWLR